MAARWLAALSLLLTPRLLGVHGQYVNKPATNIFVAEEGRLVDSYGRYQDHMLEQKINIKQYLKDQVDELRDPGVTYLKTTEYSYEPPKQSDYLIGLLLDPCKTLNYDCCLDVYGTPEYGLLDPVDPDFRVVTKRPIASDDDVSLNFVVTNEYSTELPSTNIRRASEQTLVDDECLGVGDPYTYCTGPRKANYPFPIDPACKDNNQTVEADIDCYDIHGDSHAHCVQVAYSQSAMSVICAGEFKNDSDCGTFIELHMENGSPYQEEDAVINAVKIESANTSGYNTTVLPLFFDATTQENFQGMTRVLCAYRETRVRVGSMVLVKASAPQCCCPTLYTDATFYGYFFCPTNRQRGQTLANGGPFAVKLDSLLDNMAEEVDVDTYPYCTDVYQYSDVMMCSRMSKLPGRKTTISADDDIVTDDTMPHTDATVITPDVYTKTGYSIPDRCAVQGVAGCKRGNRFYTFRCPEVALDNYTQTYKSSMLRGSYVRQCPYFDTCARAAFGKSCNVSETDPLDRDETFTFAGRVGKVTYVPPDNAADGYDKYRVSFNDGRTDYQFDIDDLELESPAYNYQLWWVQRTRYNRIILKKKGFKVTSPQCTFDTVNDQYYPFALIDEDGEVLDGY